jgi:hypothetical protein
MGLFDFFKKKNTPPPLPALEMADLSNNALQEGDIVEGTALRPGPVQSGKGWKKVLNTNPWQTGQRVSYLRMVDAITGFQKVKKVG